MKADFETIAAFGALFLNSAGVTALYRLLDRDDAKKAAQTLREAIKPDLTALRPDRTYVANARAAVARELYSIGVILLHVVNLAILVTLAVILWVGPDQVFSAEEEGALADPLTSPLRVAYWVWWGLNVIAYVVSGVSPTLAWFRLWRKGKAWLKNDAANRTRRNGRA